MMRVPVDNVGESGCAFLWNPLTSGGENTVHVGSSLERDCGRPGGSFLCRTWLACRRRPKAIGGCWVRFFLSGCGSALSPQPPFLVPGASGFPGLASLSRIPFPVHFKRKRLMASIHVCLARAAMPWPGDGGRGGGGGLNRYGDLHSSSGYTRMPVIFAPINGAYHTSLRK